MSILEIKYFSIYRVNDYFVIKRKNTETFKKAQFLSILPEILFKI